MLETLPLKTLPHWMQSLEDLPQGLGDYLELGRCLEVGLEFSPVLPLDLLKGDLVGLFDEGVAKLGAQDAASRLALVIGESLLLAANSGGVLQHFGGLETFKGVVGLEVVKRPALKPGVREDVVVLSWLDVLHVIVLQLPPDRLEWNVFLRYDHQLLLVLDDTEVRLLQPLPQFLPLHRQLGRLGACPQVPGLSLS